jgi:mono/diheme cytochrome c family protein
MPKVLRQSLRAVNLRLMTGLLAGASIPIFAAVTSHAADKPVAQSPAVKRGDTLFHQRCAVCHSKQPGDNTPFGPPNLYQIFRKKTITVAEATEIVHKGKGPMPAFGESITNTQIKDVVAYLSAH